MALIEVLLPAMGEGIIEATLISWMKNEGESVALDENLIEVATDKVNSEVPSTAIGVLHKKLFSDNDVISVGKPFAIISTGGEEELSPAPIISEKIEEKKVEELVKKEVAQIESNIAPPIALTSNEDRFYSPLVINIAKEEGISQAELDSITGSGQSGRVTKDDMLLYLQNRKSGSQQKTILPSPINTNIEANNQKNALQSSPEKMNAAIDFGPNVEVQKMDRMRKLIGEHMIKSVQTSAHVCSFVEADMTNVVLWRNKVKTKFKEKYGENLTFTPILIEAIAKALIEFPMINSSIDGDNVLLKKEINIGMAAALPDGNLIVPVIKNADMLNLLGLAKKVNDLGQRAKKNQLKPDEIQGGTYTMTNLGSFGNLFGTPIINQPQVAILGVGAIIKKPVVVESPEGDTIGIRSMMYLSHSYDHRVVDGMLGGTFVKRVAEILEGFDVNRDI
jgi:2-oxoglutarate dehydrogenase E2 component (dihydrolipoamide succinyltransferase)